MKRLVLSLFALAALTASSAFAADYPATHCEIFVDKILPTRGSHGSSSVVLYVKTLNDRLDGAIAEVGFYGKEDIKGGRPGQWRVLPLQRFVGAPNYFELTLNVGSDFGSSVYEGALFVRTTNGTTYWAKSKAGTNFTFDRGAVDFLSGIYSWGGPYYGSNAARAFPTQNDKLDSYNGQRCY